MCPGCTCYGKETTPRFVEGTIIDHALFGKGWIMATYGNDDPSVLAVFKEAHPTGQVVHACELEVIELPAPQA